MDGQTPLPTDAHERHILTLLTWFSPAFPIGAFSYSHGLEWAVETGDIGDAETLRDWIAALLENGSGWTDAVLFAEAWRCGSNRLPTADVADLAAALQPGEERLLETAAQGRAFRDTVRTAWFDADTAPGFETAPDGLLALPVAAGVACGAKAIPLESALHAYLHGFVSNLVSAGQRLVPLGQTDGQIVTAALLPVIDVVTGKATRATLDDLGGACFRSDIASMNHETQYTRLFRS